ncbi:HD-GYP domain-containing protein [Bacillus sp. REN16]|uniref:HD-GYP domain-containing protein n=1 Tax=Bacillus sp. REN16 TaxID=2887296 RepID=UPI001E5695E6|nr:HD-GYP domain-containing protein [Bacillus sp. REN16]MCC3359336.1 HD-GYP domain-containing protein [Bacillus sp. REN16]
MRVRISQLQEGCILSNDIFSLTNKPIIPKKTVLTIEHIQVLQVFLVKDVQVETFLINGEPFTPNEQIEEIEVIEKENSIVEDYLKSVKEYKQLFQSWQAGALVEIAKVRKIILPLFNRMLEQPKELFSLHRYTNREDYIYHHSVMLGLLSGYLGGKLKYGQGDCNHLAIAGLLSDCGMAKIDPKILVKNSSLTLTEYNDVKRHPLYSYRMIEKISLIKDGVKLAVLQHHERMDGTGYVLGVTGERLHPFSKIVAVADVYSAMTLERPYSNRQTPFKALEEIRRESFGQFDMEVIDALTNGVGNISIGTKVKLSNGQSGEIVFIDKSYPTRPLLKISETEFLDLKAYRELFIEEII